jgi:ABC-type amino acid transport substrate-binding protein
MLKWLFVFLFLASSAHARSFFSSQAECERRYVVSFLGNPPAYIVEKGVKGGSAYDVLTELMRRTGCRYTEQPASHSAARENFMNNRVDVFGFTGPDPMMDKHGEYVEMVKLPRFLVINKKYLKSVDTFKSILQFRQILFGSVIAGNYFYTQDELDLLRKTKRLREVPSPADVFNSLIADRIQASLTVPLFTHYYLTRVKQREKFEVIPDLHGDWTSVGFYLSHKRLSATERERLKKLIVDIRQDGTLEKIQQKYNDPTDLKYYQPIHFIALAWSNL